MLKENNYRVYLVEKERTYTDFDKDVDGSKEISVSDVVINDILKYENKYYVVSAIDLKTNRVIAELIKNYIMNGTPHEYKMSLVCPYCGYEEVDSCEYSSDNSDETDCCMCGNTFRYDVHREVTFSTYPVLPGTFREIS